MTETGFAAELIDSLYQFWNIKSAIKYESAIWKRYHFLNDYIDQALKIKVFGSNRVGLRITEAIYIIML